MARSVAACLAILLALFEVGSCINCYQCNSQNDKTCGDPFKAGNQLVDCKSKASVDYNQQYLYNVLAPEVFGSVLGAPRYCHKIVMASGTVIRTCLDGNPTDMNHACRVMERNSQVSTAEKRIQACTVCDKDNCNAAGSLSSLPLAVVTLIASYVFYKQ